MEPGLKVEVVAVVKFLFCFLITGLSLFAQTLPDDELQVNLNTYFDNFGVAIAYPAISVTKQIAQNTSVNGRYLVDMISAASMRSLFRVDGVTSASKRTEGGGAFPDEIRHEFTGGITQAIGDVRASVNAIYSTENDYYSRTLAADISIPFALKNTILSLGVVKSWDIVAPDNRSWEKDKNVLSLNAGLTQNITKSWLIQLNLWYSNNSGFLSDAYQVIGINNLGRVKFYSPAYPDNRDRRAAGIRTVFALDDISSIQVGYRYYWDTWDIKSNTANILYQRYLSENIRGVFGWRIYNQSKAYFFLPEYTAPLELMAVDSKLNESVTNEFEVSLKFKNQVFNSIPVLRSIMMETAELSIGLNFYMRNTVTPDWHSRYRMLYAYIATIGYRYKF